MNDDFELSDDSCPKCSQQMAYRECSAFCCEDGTIEDEDDEWKDGTICSDCRGMGYEEWCRECGWDNVFKCFLSPKYKAEWEAKHQPDSASST